MMKIYDNIEINSDYDYYGWLRVDKNATTEEIIKAGEDRRVELLSASANMSGEDVATSFTLLELAVKILSNEETRKAYDSLVEEVNNEVNKDFMENLVASAEKQIESNKKDERIEELENETDALKKQNELYEDYIRELENKLSSKDNQELIDDSTEDKKIENKDEYYTDDSNSNNEENDSEKELEDVKIEEDNNKEENNNKEEDNNNEEDSEKDKSNDEKVKVVKEEVASNEVIKAAQDKMDSMSVLKTSCIIALIASIGIGGYIIHTANKQYDEFNQKKLEEQNSKINNIDDNEEDSVEQSMDDFADVTQIEEESIEVTFDPNNEEVIQGTVDKIYSEISKSNKDVVKNLFDRDTVEALVRYTRDNSVLSGETAYSLFRTLYENRIDISMFFENLDSYEYANNLYKATSNVDENNGKYDDEYEAYLAMGDAIDKMNPENYAEVCYVSVNCDYSTFYSSMNIVRGGAEEIGNEGPEYIDEKNKVHSNVRQECSDIYNKVRNDKDSILTQYKNNLLNNESTRTRN